MLLALLSSLSLPAFVQAGALPPVDEHSADLGPRGFRKPFVLNIASKYCDNIIVNAHDEFYDGQGSGITEMIPAQYAGDDGSPQKLFPEDSEDEYCKIAEVTFNQIPKEPRVVDIGTGTKKVDGNAKNLYVSRASPSRERVLTFCFQCTVDFKKGPGVQPLTWFIGLPLNFDRQPSFNITCWQDCELLGDSNNSKGLTCMDSYFDLVASHA